MPETDWFPSTEPEQLIAMENINTKIGGYAVQLELDAADVARIQLLAQTFIAAVNAVLIADETAEALTAWKNSIKNEPKKAGNAAPAAPVFAPIALPAGATLGTVDQMRKEVRRWKDAAGYTEQIGLDLGIVKPKADPPNLSELKPVINVNTAAGYKITVKWKKEGMDALRFEYQRKGTETWQSFFLTKSPGEVTVTPFTPGQPESGLVRGIFIKDNQPVGTPSDLVPITLS